MNEQFEKVRAALDATEKATLECKCRHIGYEAIDGVPAARAALREIEEVVMARRDGIGNFRRLIARARAWEEVSVAERLDSGFIPGVTKAGLDRGRALVAQADREAGE